MGNVSLEEFRTSINLLAQALTAQPNRKVVAHTIGETCAYRIREILIPLKFSGSKVEEDLNGFIEEVYNIHVMRIDF